MITFEPWWDGDWIIKRDGAHIGRLMRVWHYNGRGKREGWQVIENAKRGTGCTFPVFPYIRDAKAHARQTLV